MFNQLLSKVVKGRLDSIEPQGIGGHMSIEKPNTNIVINLEDKKGVDLVRTGSFNKRQESSVV